VRGRVAGWWMGLRGLVGRMLDAVGEYHVFLKFESGNCDTESDGMLDRMYSCSVQLSTFNLQYGDGKLISMALMSSNIRPAHCKISRHAPETNQIHHAHSHRL